MGESRRCREAEKEFDRLVSLKVRQANPRLPLWLVAILAGVTVLMFWLSPARAHSFYPWECCSSQDCWPTGKDADAREPDPIGTDSGWLLQDGTIVPYAAARQSPDGRFHVCRRGATLSGQLITPYSQPPCLWAPVPGS